MNFTAYPLYVGNSKDFSEFKEYGDHVELVADSDNVAWDISDSAILEFMSCSGRTAEVRALRTGFADVTARHEDGTCEVCHISVIDTYRRLTVNRVEFNADRIVLAPGAETRIIPIIYPKEIYNNGMLDKRLLWESSDEGVAKACDGVITAVGEGSAYITVNSLDVGRTAGFSVDVSRDADAADISVIGSKTAELTVGERLQLKALSESRITWRSSDSFIADVDENGVVTAYSSSNRLVPDEDELDYHEETGTVSIFATAENGGRVAEFSLVVKDAPRAVHSVEINKKKVALAKGGHSYVTAVITPSYILEKDIVWSSSDDSILSVEPADKTRDGINRARITAKAAGVAYIKAEYGGRSDTCIVTVTKAEIRVSTITLEKEHKIEVDEVYRLKASVTEHAADDRLIWIGTDDDIATVDRDGTVMGYKAGGITVYAIARDSVTDAAAQEIRDIKRKGKRTFTPEELKKYLKVYAACRLTVSDESPCLRNIHIVPEAVTYDSINVLWNRAALTELKDFKKYIIYVNGERVAETTALGYTANGLMPQTEYLIKVEAVSNNGEVLTERTVFAVTKPKPTEIINVLDRGAVGNGRVLDTYAIQKAIDECPANGEVYLPEGYVFVSGALFLKSDMTLRVDGLLIGSISPKDYPRMISRWEGWRKLRKSPDEWENSFNDPWRIYMADSRYPHSSLINAGTYNEGENGEISPCNVKNIVIRGRGQINANGFALAYNEGPNWTRHREPDFYKVFPAIKNQTLRGTTIKLHNAENVYVKDVQSAYSPSWTTHYIYCNNMTIDNTSIISSGFGNAGDGDDLHNCVHIYNGDGIDPESSRNMNIFNTFLRTGDDGITLKSGRNREGYEVDKPNAFIRITDCVADHVLGGFGTGSEDAAGEHDILYQNLLVRNAEIFGFWFKTTPVRGSLVENIQLRDCCVDNTRSGLVFSHEYSKGGANNPAPALPVMRRFTIENLTGNTREYAIRIDGYGDESITKMLFKNINIESPEGIITTKCLESEMEGLFDE